MKTGTAVNWNGNLGVVTAVLPGGWVRVKWAGCEQGWDELQASQLSVDPT